jgi:hypothetical protein
MEHLYNGHLIQVSVWEDSTGWVVNLYVSYQEGVQSRLITFMLLTIRGLSPSQSTAKSLQD